jgi:hypothetical protein
MDSVYAVFKPVKPGEVPVEIQRSDLNAAEVLHDKDLGASDATREWENRSSTSPDKVRRTWKWVSLGYLGGYRSEVLGEE